MAIFAINAEKIIMYHAMPAEKAVPTPEIDSVVPAKQATEKKEAQTGYLKTAQLIAEPTAFLTGIDYIKLLTAFAFLAISIFFLIGARNDLTSTNQRLQDIQNQTAELNGQKQNLTQEIHELSNYDRVMKIAKEHGLEMNEDNIRNVEK